MKYNSNEMAEKLSNSLHFHVKLTFFLTTGTKNVELHSF